MVVGEVEGVGGIVEVDADFHKQGRAVGVTGSMSSAELVDC